jgi:hypothetical protein
MNIEMIKDSIVYLVDHIPKVHIGLNFVEYSQDQQMDFAKEKTTRFYLTEEDLPLIENLKNEILSLSQDYKNHIQTPLMYLENPDYILKLNYHCQLNDMALGLDCDGTIRLCGYQKLLGDRLTIWDLKKSPNFVFKKIVDSWGKCKGCYWAYPYILEFYSIDGVLFGSNFWQERVNIEEKK